MLTQKQIKEMFAQYGFAPLKRLGENYLIDANIKDKIIAALGIRADDSVLEIGPGLGALTIDLAGSGARVIAVEKDRKAVEVLAELTKNKFPNLKIINGDILEFDIRSISDSGKTKVVGNLPYYITTPALELLLKNSRYFSLAVIMVQKEVAMRMMAGPGDEEYGSLSCFVQYYAACEYVHTVKRTCFYPAPAIDSAVIKLNIRDKPSVSVKSEELFFKVMRGAFNQRRKSVINSLSREAVLDMPKEKLTQILNSIGIDPTARPETLSIADFAKIANAV